MDIKQAVSMSGCCEQGCYKHRGVCISLNYNFVQICAQEWDWWITWQLWFQFFEQVPYVFSRKQFLVFIYRMWRLFKLLNYFFFFIVYAFMCMLIQLRPTLCDPMDCSPSGSSVHRISQARILECANISFSRGSSWARDWTWISCIFLIDGQILHHWATWEACIFLNMYFLDLKYILYIYIFWMQHLIILKILRYEFFYLYIYEYIS